MKLKLFLIIIYALTFNYLNAQDQNSSNFDFNKYIVDNVSNPRSPEANAMEKYGNIGVNYYNGKPDISIPLHSITGREFNVPISINYAVQGLIVDQVATNVGYGWNLNAGGRISVIKNGMADFNELSNLSIKNPAVRQQINQALIRHQQNEFNNSNEAIQHYNFIRDIAEGKTDGLYDLYSLNAIGINDYIVFDNNTFLPKALKNYRIKIEAFIVNNILTGWKVINDDGTEYYFGQHQPSGDESFEKTFITGDDSGANHYNGAQYISSWLLKKIISKTKKDTIIFNYKKLNWNKEYGLFDIAAQSYVYFSSPINQNPSPSTQYSFTPSYKTTQLFLENVYVNGELEMSLNYKSREDIIYENNSVADFTIKSALDKITFPSLGSKKEIVFHHTYFGYNNPTESIFTKYKNIRLKLDAIEISGIQDVEIEAIGNQNISQNYSFEYERPHLMPSIDFKSNDYNGIFNGTQNSSTLKDNNQRFNFNAATIGILKKINYPTGGYTEFEYEAETKKPLFSETWWEEQHIASASSPPATSPMYLCWSTMDGYFKGATNQFTLNESHFLITDEFLEYTPFQISSNSLTIINEVDVRNE